MKLYLLIASVLLVAACQGARESPPADEPVQNTAPGVDNFRIFAFDLDEMRQLITFNGWVVANLPMETSSAYECNLERLTRELNSDDLECFLHNDAYQIVGMRHGLLFVTDSVYLLPVHGTTMVNFDGNRYVVSGTFYKHGKINSHIVVVDDPKKLPAFALKNLSENLTAIKPEDLSAGQSVLLDTTGVSVCFHYPFNGRDYVFYSVNVDKDTVPDLTLLGEIQKGKIVPRDTVMQMPASTIKTTPAKVINGIYTYDYTYRVAQGESTALRSEGSIYVKADTVVVGYRYSDAALRRGGKY
ncbi:MAG TPA: hypothetical protein VD816_01700 [Ohtaekwangia sp.]|nr:hypothetical protein [Ohtaekwangia sp.]